MHNDMVSCYIIHARKLTRPTPAHVPHVWHAKRLLLHSRVGWSDRHVSNANMIVGTR